MGDKVLRSHTGEVPKIEFPARAQNRDAIFRAVRLDERGAVMFELILPGDPPVTYKPFRPRIGAGNLEAPDLKPSSAHLIG